MSAYIAELNRLVAAQSPPPRPQSLRTRFVDWYESLPEFTRARPFSMSEFEAALKNSGKIHKRYAISGGLAAQTNVEHDRAISSILAATERGLVWLSGMGGDAPLESVFP